MNLISKLLSVFNSGEPKQEEPIPPGWHSTFAAAKDAAKETDKLVLVKVHADWCGLCKSFDNDVSSMQHLSNYLNNQFACARVKETSREGKHFKKTHKIGGFPCFLIYSSSDKFLGKVRGYDSADSFIDSLRKTVSLTNG